MSYDRYKPKLCFIAAVAENGVIGDRQTLPWRLPADLKRFRSLTIGKPVIMGRKTYESIGHPLPQRETIVLTTHPDLPAPSPTLFAAKTLAEALRLGADRSRQLRAEEIMIAGGSTIFSALLDRADKIYLTRVHAHPTGDVHFPEIDWSLWRETSHEAKAADATNEFPYTFLTYERLREEG